MGRVYAAHIYGGELPEEEIELSLCETYNCTHDDLYEQDDDLVRKDLAIMAGRQQARKFNSGGK